MPRELQDFGEIVAKHNQNYLALRDSEMFVAVNRCVVFEGVVESFRSVDSSWWELRLAGQEQLLELHNNWVVDNKALKPGDDVEGVRDSDSNKLWLIRRKARIESEVAT